jgi:hypothetical protein
MMANSDELTLQRVLESRGLCVSQADLPYLLLTIQRQRRLVDSWNDRVEPQTEPAHIFALSHLRPLHLQMADPVSTQ